MSTDQHTGSAWFTVDESIQRYVLGDRHSAYPVEGFDGHVEGPVTLARLRAVQPETRNYDRSLNLDPWTGRRQGFVADWVEFVGLRVC